MEGKNGLDKGMGDIALQVLREIFHYEDFRNSQEMVIRNILSGRDTLAIMPTGAGKSICFQIPALIFGGMTVVISPLIALMKDQVDNLKRRGINNAEFLNSSLNEEEQGEIYSRAGKGEIKILYIAPETLLNNRIISLLKETKISLLAIDEAHCVSTWGHDFRPDYLKVREVIKELGNPPVLALTATANEKVERDVIEQLGRNMDVFKDSFERKNLYLSIVKLKPGQKKDSIVKEILKKNEGSAIIYVNFVKTSESLSEHLKKQGFSCEHYNGSLESGMRKEVQNRFLNGDIRIIVATNAFGMGIDKPDIRLIVHYDVPKSLENYYQETGRAGRDGKDSHCVLLYSQEDSVKLKKFIRMAPPGSEKIEKLQRFFEGNSGKTIYVNQKALSNEMEIDDVTIRLLMHYFESFKLIKVHSRVFKKVMIRSRGEIPEHARSIFSSHYYEKNRDGWLDLEELSRISGTGIAGINTILHEMKSKGEVDFLESDAVNPVEISRGIRNANLGEIESLFLKLTARSIEKLRDVLNYINCESCKKKFILNYFGEAANHSCRMCNFCNPEILKLESGLDRKNLSEKDFQILNYHQGGEIGRRVRATFIILDAIRELDSREVHVGKNTLADFLRASKSKRVLHFRNYGGYGKLKDFSGAEVSGIIAYLIREGYVSVIDADSEYPRPLLYLSEHGELLMKEKEKIGVK